MNWVYFLLLIFCISIPVSGQTDSLELLSIYHGYGNIISFDVKNDRLYLVAGDYLQVYDIGTSGTYTKLGERAYNSNNITNTTQISTNGNYLYSSNGGWGILIFDISDPSSIVQKGRHYPSITNTAQGFTIDDNTIGMPQIVGYGGSSVILGDMSDPLNIIEKGKYIIPFYSEHFSVALKNERLYLVAEKYYENNYLGADMLLVDISDLNNPIQTFRLHSGFDGLALQDHYLLTRDTSNTLKIFDVNDLSNAVLVNEIPFANMDYSIDNYHLVTDKPIQSGYQQFSLYNSESITNLVLKDTLFIQNNSQPYSPKIINNRLLLKRSNDLTIYDLSNETFEYDKKITLAGSFYAKDMVAKNGYTYLISTKGLYTLDISNPKSPLLKSYIQLTDTYSELYSIVELEDYLYIGGTKGLRIVDVTNPASPVLRGSINTGVVYDLFAKGDIVYLTSYNTTQKGFEIIDISDKNNPHEIAFANINEGADAITVDSCYAYVFTDYANSNYFKNLHIFDISSPYNPIELSSKQFSFSGKGIIISGNYAYLATNDGLKIASLSDKLNPVIVSSFGLNSNVEDVFFREDTVVFGTQYDGFYVIDVTDKSLPVQLTNFNNGKKVLGVYMEGERIYAALPSKGMYIFALNPENDHSGGNDSTGNDSTIVPTNDPMEFTMLQNYPNPFNSQTKIQYYVNITGLVEIEIYDIIGKRVNILVNSIKDKGWHTLTFHPQGLTSGIYFLNAKTNHHSKGLKLLYIK